MSARDCFGMDVRVCEIEAASQAACLGELRDMLRAETIAEGEIQAMNWAVSDTGNVLLAVFHDVGGLQVRTLARAVRASGTSGEPLPCPIKAFSDIGFTLKRGQLSLWIAAPGVGKSILSLNWVLRSGAPALYVSSDTDRTDQGERAAACLTGDPIESVKRSFLEGEPKHYLDTLAGIDPRIGFEFDSSPTAPDLAEMCEAYGMVWGAYPHLIVVDTIGKVWSDGDETARNKEAVDRCQEIARKTGAHVMALHHATKGYDSGDTPIPLQGVLSGTSKIPEQVISMWRDAPGRLCFSPIKNRSGPADPTATQLRGWVSLDTSRMQVDSIQAALAYEPWRDPEAS